MSTDTDAHTPRRSGRDMLDYVAQLCFADAVRYFHARLDDEIQDHTPEGAHPDRPTTAREYFREVRGWTEETIEHGLLGWAPPGDENELVEHLRERGYTDEEMLATGLFWKNLTPLWQGRYVLPYFDRDDEPVFAISRATDKDDPHPDDARPGKYDRPQTTKEYVRISEPIFGIHTVRWGKPLIITEGITDAITVHQTGYPCIAPVALRFANQARDELPRILSEYEIPRVYVIQDAERPGAQLNAETERLELDQHGPGLKGAIETATFLRKNGIDAYVNTPPRIGVRKLDLDAYLRDGWGTLDTLLRSAKPPAQHPAYAEERAVSTSEISPETPSRQIPRSDGQSALTYLDITDVTGLRVGYRGTNPLGHIGDSEDYFIVFDGRNDPYAYDHKRHAAYTPLSYLLCEAGERPIDNPGGPLSDREYFVAWKHAKERGLLPTDDPIPHKGLMHVAVEHGLCDPEDIEGGWKIPLVAYNRALTLVREEYGLDPGRDPYEERNPERVALLLSQTDTEWDWRASSDREQAGKRLTKEDAQARCQKLINTALVSGDRVLIDALPTLGKSSGVIRGAAETGIQITVFTARHTLYHQLADWCEEEGLDQYTLGAFHRDCETAKGTHGQTWEERVWNLYENGATAGKIHQKADEYFGQPLPCQEHGDCPYTAKWHFDPDDYDVLIGHYLHANNPRVTAGRVVVFDESCSDAFLTTLSKDRLEAAITVYLQQNAGLPFDDYDQLIAARDNRYNRKMARSWFTRFNPNIEPDDYGVFKDESGDAHALAPLATYALLFSRDLGNEWEHTMLPDNRLAAFDRDEEELHLLLPPSLGETTGVLALDGTPWREGWQMSLGTDLTHQQVLTDEERADYLRDVLGYRIIVTNEHVKPYSSGKWVTPPSDGCLFKWVYEQHGKRPALITSQNALEKYREAGVLAPISETAYYGDIKGMNDFREVRLGIVAGSTHYGDTHVEKWGALAGKPVTANEERGFDRSYGPFGDAILENMREHEVFQAVMRFGRDGNGATVYVHTGALPEWVPIAARGKVVGPWSEGMWQVIDVIYDRDEWRMRDIVTGEGDNRKLDIDHAEPISERQVRRHLTTLTDLGYLERRREGNGYVWTNVCLDELNESARIDFEQ